jgi:hypothetical protein
MAIRRTLLAVICLLILLSILVAGLWPFHAPRNEVSWLSGGEGLLLGKYGSIVTMEGFKASESKTDYSSSIELWVEPRRGDQWGTILAFYMPDRQVLPFQLRQFRDSLELERNPVGPLSNSRKAKFDIGSVFIRSKLVFVTISSDREGTAIYVNGLLVRKSSNFRLSNQDLIGQLIIGNAPDTTDTWSGTLKTVAIYDRGLTADEAYRHYAERAMGKGANLADWGATALYRFDEGNGSIVHSSAGSATDLLIPKRFFVLREQFLELPWNEFYPRWSYWKNIGINIAGFIPLGFFVCAYFSLGRKFNQAVAMTVLLGFSVSLTIEVLQALLPTRDSGTTDLITNTFGTAMGAVLYPSLVNLLFGHRGLSLGSPTIEEKEDLQLAS